MEPRMGTLHQLNIVQLCIPEIPRIVDVDMRQD
jgi:hypothetical protein